MAVCLKSSDATNVRWGPYAPDQGPDRDRPLGYLIASGMFSCSYEAEPVAPYLGVLRVALKGVGKRFEPIGDAGRALDGLGIGAGVDLVGAAIDDLVGEQ